MNKGIVKIRRNGETVERYASVKEAAEKNFIAPTSVTQRCCGKIKKEWDEDGCSFRYAEEVEASNGIATDAGT